MAIELPIEGQTDWDTTLNKALRDLDTQAADHAQAISGVHGAAQGEYLAVFAGGGRTIFVGTQADTSRMVPGDMFIKIDLGA